MKFLIILFQKKNERRLLTHISYAIYHMAYYDSPQRCQIPPERNIEKCLFLGFTA